MGTELAGQPRTSASGCSRPPDGFGNPLLGPFGAVLGFGQLELQATDLIPCPGAKLLKRFFRVPFNTPDMLVRFAPDPLGLGLGPLCPLLRLRRFAFEASEHSFGLRPRPSYALVSFSLSSRNSLVRLRLDLRDPSTRFSRPLPSLREFGLQTREAVLRFSIELCLQLRKSGFRLLASLCLAFERSDPLLCI